MPRVPQQVGRVFGLGIVELHDLEARRAGLDTLDAPRGARSPSV
jgi:hypothetical protein